MSEHEPPRRRRLANPPVERASTVLIDRADDMYGLEPPPYGRFGFAVHEELRAQFSALQGGVDTTLVGSGLQACTTAIAAFTKAGDHVLVADGAYRPVRGFCEGTLARFGVETEFYDPRIGAGIAAKIRPNTALVYLESPDSLTLEIQDVPAIAAAARAAGVASLIDDTWSAGVFLKPLALGVDAVAHAATKYPSGASDVFLGAITARDAATAAKIRDQARATGACVSPDDAYLVLRGLRALELRMARHQESGLDVAAWLAARPEVAHVIHPARPDHPDHALWKRDFTGASGVFAIALAPCPTPALHAFLDALRVIQMGFSFGGFESLVIHANPQLKRDHAGAESAAILRFSIGLEPVEALISDLETAFAAMAAISR